MKRDLNLVLVSLFATANLALALWLAANDKTASSAVSGVLGLLLLVFLQLSKFKKFKGLGFEAELWEDKKREAEVLIAQSKELLTLLATTVLTIIPRMNRMMEGFSKEEQVAVADEVNSILKTAGVSTNAAQALCGEIDRFGAFDIALPICNDVQHAIQNQGQVLRQAVGSKYGSPITDNVGYSRDIDEVNNAIKEMDYHAFDAEKFFETPIKSWPDHLRDRIKAIPRLPDSVKAELLSKHTERLLDLEAWVNGRKIRRPETFLKA